MRWLFVTGLSLDISGAVLVLAAILAARPTDIGREGVTTVGYSGARIASKARERGFAWAGATLLVTGFVLQLAAYVSLYDSIWLLVYAAAAILCTSLLGRLVARTLAARFRVTSISAAEALIEEADKRDRSATR